MVEPCWALQSCLQARALPSLLLVMCVMCVCGTAGVSSKESDHQGYLKTHIWGLEVEVHNALGVQVRHACCNVDGNAPTPANKLPSATACLHVLFILTFHCSRSRLDRGTSSAK